MKPFAPYTIVAKSDSDLALVGKQGGSFPFLGITTDDCLGGYERLKARAVKFQGEPEVRPYGAICWRTVRVWKQRVVIAERIEDLASVGEQRTYLMNVDAHPSGRRHFRRAARAFNGSVARI